MCKIERENFREVLRYSLRQAHPNGTDQTDYAHVILRASAPAGGVLIYDLDVVYKVVTERRWELVCGCTSRVCAV